MGDLCMQVEPDLHLVCITFNEKRGRGCCQLLLSIVGVEKQHHRGGSIFGNLEVL